MSPMNSERLLLARGKLGEKVYVDSDNFILWDPYMNIIKPIYNTLHDPHLKTYLHRKDILDRLKKGNYISEDNEVRCTYREYRIHQRYLEEERLIATRANRDVQRANMRQFLERQEAGLIAPELTLTDVREQLLDEEVERLWLVMKGEAPWGKGRYAIWDIKTKIDLVWWKEELRRRLHVLQSEVQHEWNRERQLREAAEGRERKKVAVMVRKIIALKPLMIEQTCLSEESLTKERNKQNIPPSESHMRKNGVTPSQETSQKKTIPPSRDTTGTGVSSSDISAPRRFSWPGAVEGWAAESCSRPPKMEMLRSRSLPLLPPITCARTPTLV